MKGATTPFRLFRCSGSNSLRFGEKSALDRDQNCSLHQELPQTPGCRSLGDQVLRDPAPPVGPSARRAS
jgi:hypothetical protein